MTSQTLALPAAAPVRLPPRPGYWGMVGRRLRRDPATVVFCLLMLAIVLAAVAAPLLSPFDPYKESIILRLKPFGTRGHWLGTDELGRDILARILYGGRSSLLMGVGPVVFAGLVGGSLGVLAGYAGGWVGTLVMRTMDVFYARSCCPTLEPRGASTFSSATTSPSARPSRCRRGYSPGCC